MTKSKIFFSKRIMRIWAQRRPFTTGFLSFVLRIFVSFPKQQIIYLYTSLLVMRFVFNFVILAHALRRLPEFSGYKGRRYPGEQEPRRSLITPRRLDLPQDFQEDWRKIGSKRNKMVTFDAPVTSITFVLPSKQE